MNSCIFASCNESPLNVSLMGYPGGGCVGDVPKFLDGFTTYAPALVLDGKTDEKTADEAAEASELLACGKAFTSQMHQTGEEEKREHAREGKGTTTVQYSIGRSYAGCHEVRIPR